MRSVARHVALLVAAIGAAVGVSGCASEPVFNGPIGVLEPEWTAAELAKPFAVKKIYETQWASHHIVHLVTAEVPHVHDRHDGTVFILHGTARLHLGEQVIDLKPGDTAVIPHGSEHWAENTGGEPVEAYVVFTPPYDGTDMRPVK